MYHLNHSFRFVLLTPVMMKAEFFDASKYFTVVSEGVQVMNQHTVAKASWIWNDGPSVLGYVFSNRRARSGSFSLAFMYLITL